MSIKIDYDKMTRKFMLGESKASPDLFSYVQSLEQILNRLSPKTMRDVRDLEIAKENLREIKKGTKKLVDKVSNLEEQLAPEE